MNHAQIETISEDTLLGTYANLIHYAIHTYYPYRRGIEYEDLFQIGSIALLKAYRSYQPDRGASFVTFALLNLRSAMYKIIRKNTALKRKGSVVSLDAARTDTGFCLLDTIADPYNSDEFESVLLKICIEEGSYERPMQQTKRRTAPQAAPVSPLVPPVRQSIDLSSFIIFNAANSGITKDSTVISVTKSGKVTLSSAIGAKYKAGEKLEVLINQPGNIIVIRPSLNGIACRLNGRNTTGKTITCRALTDHISKKKIELPIRFQAEWDEAVQGFVGKR